MSETTASRAILMFCTEPRMWMWLLSAGVDRRAAARRYLRVGEHDTRPAGVLDGELDLAALTGDTAWMSAWR
jgi:hypothetical protein